MARKLENKDLITPMDEVMFIKRLYDTSGSIFCRHCRSLKKPLRKRGDFNKFNKTQKEQYYSGVCSDKCWYDSSEQELTLYKFMCPLYLHKECVRQKVNMMNEKGEITEIDHTKNEIYDYKYKC